MEDKKIEIKYIGVYKEVIFQGIKVKKNQAFFVDVNIWENIKATKQYEIVKKDNVKNTKKGGA